MADNRDNRSGRDRSRIAGNEDYELRYMAEKLGVTKNEVKQAIAAVGNDRKKVEEYLQQRGR
jgi:hypothetical protein